ncbi:MAG: SDR family NAD(P)-dependent oxidoreductase [Desulfovibrio sp.]|nr:SDR family NAD(P)-dependent oxidoreductase [Desulfovibrio sp.]
MANVISEHIAVIGMAFRFPGNIRDVAGMWALLSEGRHGITRIPADRWPVDELQHPDRAEAGRSVTFAAGALTDIDQFDAGFFGISPREAAWQDPQQRLLLEMSWECLEDAGIRPSALAGSDCGVYVGISGMDYGQHALEDLASMTAHTMTGNTLSIAANRLSWFFDLHGPSLAVDTACSSSLVALHHACQALRAGDIPVALAGGISLLMHPYSFIGFSKASMISANGRCRPFDARADGYVRSEGGAVLLLKTLEQAQKDGDRIHAVILASGVNADGARKSGLTIPSAVAQAELMQRVLSQSGLTPDELDFIEAHGTGTPVGDPVEAASIGQVYGKGRSTPMPMGSVKANMGHLEPASGMAGLVKTIVTMQQGHLPPMPPDFTPTDKIDFQGLGITCPARGMNLERQDRTWLAAGVNSFGFGGVNAHIILRGPETFACEQQADAPTQLPPLILSARTDAALREIAAAYAHSLNGADSRQYYDVAYGAAFRRERLEKRLALMPATPAEAVTSLQAFSQGENPPQTVTESALSEEGGVAFVYTGNGAQWLGMGRSLYAASPVFAEALAEVDVLMQPLLGHSLIEILQQDDPEHLADTTISQPLLFAIQVGVTAVLRHLGIRPQAVTGHSVGEIAAAWASGALSLQQAVQVIHARSHAQGATRGRGRMAAAALSVQEAEEHISRLGLVECVEIAGINSPQNVTLSGDLEALQALQQAAEDQGRFFRLLDLDYAFHSRHMDGIQDELARHLEGLAPGRTSLAVFVSTVTGQALEGEALDSAYWWRNVREPVRFAPAVEELASFGCRIFVEIGPHAILQRYLREILSAAGVTGRSYGSLMRGDDKAERLTELAVRLHAVSEQTDLQKLFPYQGAHVDLPHYPWQRSRCWYPRTSECLPDKRRIHPILGWSLDSANPCWENILDPARDSWLADHKVGGAIVFPAAGYVEIALAAAQTWQNTEHVVLESLDIALPLVFDNGQAQCVRCTLEPADGSFRILGRPRLGDGAWAQHASGRIIAASSKGAQACLAPLPAGCQKMDGPALYARTAALGLDYGPTFSIIRSLRLQDDRLEADVLPQSNTAFVLPPAALDACFHALVAFYAGQEEAMAFLPVRTGRVERFRESSITQIRALLQHKGRRSLAADFELLDAQGHLVARANGCRFRAAPATQAARHQVQAWKIRPWLMPHPAELTASPLPELDELLQSAADANAGHAHEREIWFRQVLPLMEGMVLSAALQACHSLAAENPHWYESLSTPYGRWLCGLLRAEGLLEDKTGNVILASPDALPRFDELWQDALRQWPHCLPALLPLGRVLRQLPEILQGHVDGPGLLTEICTATVTRESRAADPAYAGMDSAVQGIVKQVARSWPADRRLRVLEISAAPSGLTELLAGMLPPDRFSHTLALWDSEALSLARTQYGKHASVELHAFDIALWQSEALTSQAHDVIIVRQGLHRLTRLADALSALRATLAPNGLLLATERHPDWCADVLYGLEPDWWYTADNQPQSSLLRPADWLEALPEQGFTDCQAYSELVSEGLEEGAYLLLARQGVQPAATAKEFSPASWLLLADEHSAQLAEALRTQLEAQGQSVCIACEPAPLSMQDMQNIVFMRGHAASPLAISAELDVLRSVAVACAAYEPSPRLWVITCGGALATELPAGYPAQPAQCAVAGMARVIMSEYDSLHCTLLDVTPDCPDVSALLARELLEPGSDTEIMLTAQGRYVLRLDSARADTDRPATDHYYRLDFNTPGRLNNLVWQADSPRDLLPDAVEVRVMATGLNFRDVMLVMGLVPDEAVEKGFAGPTLGLEFSGVITRVGNAVQHMTAGDKVVGFAPACFAGHVTTPAHALAHMPEGWSFEEAATIPTVFFTAWYAIKHLAQMEMGESLLIHGAAGGVGLAAIQIARYLDLRVLATAGSEEKRDLLRLMGVDEVFDSRSCSFADDVLAATDGRGVDVVLNSLAGEAMRRSVGLLKPFGRFLELGKRDFVENTALGLRPFRENISYFAIDADQLLIERPLLASRLFAEVMNLLRSDTLRPLPCRTFPATRARAAFRAMQQAQHVGKIVVTHEEAPAVQQKQDATAPQLDGNTTWLVTGGLSGFGLVTARHLVQRGVRHLVLVGRRGADSPEARQVLEGFRTQGVHAVAAACDMADGPAVQALIKRISETMPQLAGMVHAAAVFDDRFLGKLDAESLQAVLAPKLHGAWHLHEASKHLPLRYFILYSSISVSLGNPGQANYVAANAGLEGLTHLRRHMGLPATCIAWGPVGDAGYLTRHEAVKKGLAQRLDRQPLTSDEAMRQLDKALATDGLHIFANVDWNAVTGMLPANLSRFSLVAQAAEGKAKTETSLQELLAGKSPDKVREILQTLVAEEVAQVLALSTEQVPLDRSVQSLGLDSLMAVELAVGLEQRVGVRLPAMMLQDSPTITQIAERIASRLSGTAPGNEDANLLSELARRHAEDLDDTDVDGIIRSKNTGGAA